MSHLSRRQFLEDSMFAAAAAAAAGTALSGNARQALADRPARTKSANEKLSVACVGVKGRGASHIGAYAGREDTEITYICDADEAVGQGRAEGVAGSQGIKPKFVRDMREVFDDPSVDIVCTATPNHWHALCSIWAMQAGKDVYVEKPVSHNVSEGRRMVGAARRHERICQTGTQSRSNPGMREIMAAIHAGEIGEVKLSRGLCYKRRPSIGAPGEYQPPAEVDYTLWSGPAGVLPLTRPQFHYDWHWQWAYGNGDLGNQGIHQMDLARWALGVDTVGDHVLSYGGRLGYEDAGETANTQVNIHRFGDKTLVFEVRGLPTEQYMGAGVGVIVYGSTGYAVIPTYNGGSLFDLNGTMLRSFGGGEDSFHFQNFLDAVRSRNHAELNAEILDGHLSSALCHLGNISYRLGGAIPAAEVTSRLNGSSEAQETFERFSQHVAANGADRATTNIQFGQPLAIDPATESFVDNADADRHLTREYVAPFVVPKAGEV